MRILRAPCLFLVIAVSGCGYDLGGLRAHSQNDAAAEPETAVDESPSHDAPADAIADGSTPETQSDLPPRPDRPPLPTLPQNTVGRAALAAYWPLDEGAGSYTWDVTGNGNEGTFLPFPGDDMSVAGPKWLSTGFPAAKFPNNATAGFDGIDDYVEFDITTTLPEIQLPKTVSLWVRYDYNVSLEDLDSLFILLSRQRSAGVRIEIRRGRLRVATYFTTDVSPELAGVVAPPQGWHHIVYTYDGTTHTLYVNGTVGDTTTFPFDERGPPDRCRIGKSSSGVPDGFKGFIDDVRIYNRALTTTEVADLHAGAP